MQRLRFHTKHDEALQRAIHCVAPTYSGFVSPRLETHIRSAHMPILSKLWGGRIPRSSVPGSLGMQLLGSRWCVRTRRSILWVSGEPEGRCSALTCSALRAVSAPAHPTASCAREDSEGANTTVEEYLSYVDHVSKTTYDDKAAADATRDAREEAWPEYSSDGALLSKPSHMGMPGFYKGNRMQR